MISGFSIEIHNRIHFHFSTFFVSVGKWAPTVAGPLSVTFATLAAVVGLRLGGPEARLKRGAL